MKIKSLKSFLIIFSFILFSGCSKTTEIEWRSFSEDDFNFSMSFKNSKNKRFKEVCLQTNKTEKIFSLVNFNLSGFTVPDNKRISFFRDDASNKIEIFTMDYSKNEKLSENSVLTKYDDVKAYYLYFFDEKSNRTYFLISKDNLFNVKLLELKEIHTDSIKNTLVSLSDDDTGFFEEGCSFGEYDEKYQYGYFVKSRIQNCLLWVSPFLPGQIYPYM